MLIRLKKIILLSLRGEWAYLFFQLLLKLRGMLGIFRSKNESHFDPGEPYTEQEIQALHKRQINKKHSIAFLIHVYYPDVFCTDIRPILKQVDKPYDLYITLPKTIGKKSLNRLRESFPLAHFFFYENAGRDIFPFLYAYPILHSLGYDWICKLHTKKSTHLNYGVAWRQGLYRQLLDPRLLERLGQLSPSVGIVAPPHSLIPIDIFIGENQQNLQMLKTLFNLSKIAEVFVAGSMFWFRPDALRDLLKFDSFFYYAQCEPECGRVDGTLAHAYERIFSSMALNVGYKIQKIP